ncbi:ComEA family DNA-binding protein [Cnuibacter physcomitrellae]|uniref:ComEA family DNA-binding protein n=1 Tax=Cnuibacter physcomitrellae TaxID=1619308 RepID=UPI002175778F|nr:ComEA family DNA-binding protein [Cnuibacter physcomitrellae]MCS5499150.1 ComEA family DNA-binding protein [Cnuibacter physcomitrellae]
MSDLDPGPAPSAELPEARPRSLRIGVGAAIVLVLVALVVTVLVSAASPAGSTGVVVPSATGRAPSGGQPGEPGGPDALDGEADGAPGEALLVHVLGSVVTPGLYRLSRGARVVDAIAAAGGFAPEADHASVNLARPVADGEQLRVLAQGEAPPPGPAEGAGGAAAGGSASGPVDLNRATAAELDELPRIGPATAQRIIDYREEHGPFTSVDDLLEVPGIGDKTLDGLRDLVRV